MTRSSRVEAVGVGNVDSSAVGAKIVGGNGPTLKILTVVCASVVVSAITSTTLFGVFISDLTKRMDSNEHAFESVKSDVAELKQANKEAHVSSDTHNKSSTHILASEFQQVKTRVEKLETISDSYGAAITQLERVTNVLIDHTNNNTNPKTDHQTDIANIEADLTSVKHIIEMQGEILKVINETLFLKGTNASSSTDTEVLLADLEAKIEGRLLKIESETEIDRLDIDNNSQRVMLLEGNMTTVDDNLDRIKHLERNMTSEKANAKQISSNLTDLASEIDAIKTGIQNNRDEIIEHSEIIKVLNDNITAECGIVQTIGLNLNDLQTRIGTMDTVVQDNNAAIIDNSYRIRLINETVAASLENAKRFGSNITNIEQKIRTAQAAIQDNYGEINATVLDLKSLNRSIVDSISRIDSRLTNITAKSVRSSYAFSAYWLPDTSLSSGDTLIFTNTIFDEEQTYDNSTGKYTVPVSGIYLFTAKLCTSDNKEGYINFVTDGTRFGAFHVGDLDWKACSQGTAIGSLRKGSKVWLKAFRSGTIHNYDGPLGFNYFAGYLINETR